MYFLVIKIGLITFNIPLRLEDDHQLNQQLVNIVQSQPVYNSYVSILDEYSPYGLHMDTIKQLIPQYYVSYHPQSVITNLRAGESRVTQAAWLLIAIWMLKQQSVGFQLVR